MPTFSRTRKLAFLLLLISIAACATTPDEVELLDKSTRAYERALRWQEYDVVIGFHKGGRDTLTAAQRDYLKRFRVTSYDEVYLKMGPDNKTATQVVVLKYYNVEYAMVRELTINNHWEYDAKSQLWLLTNPLPKFK